MRRIGLFGGSFDPVHKAHLALAHAAVTDLALDELRWIPAGQPWQKPDRLAPTEDRAAMVRLAIADPSEGDPRFRFDDTELLRSGPSYTIDTVEASQIAEPGQDWFLVIGQDQHQRLHTWHRWRELCDRVTLAVAGRPGSAENVDPEVRARGYRVIALPPMAVSGTALRARIAAGLPIADLVPGAVASYIESHGLYRGTGANPGEHPHGGPNRPQPHRS